ncbi:membrane protein insertion efficiency factor YidD [Candidatus Peregrinibacteria bacterium CG08_land_8_20_14_0_20_41_10]|nr:MAG: membrane protein insertion efficiency factor YidD [Candidatus Peregrinibacteria bacterium CG1_02_41_10]PIS32401.1 MAG: membrane protein insertion efficiency factor YidD [Candidatus Peregrinibacteria bacterium CG08_land_8_20_14_0_20_41_10]
MMLFFRKILIQLINFYQKILSPDHSFWAKKIFPWGYCKFQPTCSEYSKQALQKYGVMKGGIKTIWRILRCNPWSRGGKDPLSH